MNYVLIQSESSDWYVCPEDKEKEANESFMNDEELPDYLIYLPDPTRLLIIDYKIRGWEE